MDMKDRIRFVMEQSKMTQQEFAECLDISPASLSSIFTGRTNPTNNHVAAIHHAFPDININWLMFGEGEQYENLNGQPDILRSASTSMSNSNSNLDKSIIEEPLLSHDIKIKKTDNVKPKIKEIRVYYDDNTFEVFLPQSLK